LKAGRLSIKVNIHLIKQYDLELLRKIPAYGELLRVVCDVRFKTTGGWTGAEDAIIDTGAHTSLLPLSLWQELDVKILADHYVRGLVPREECRMDVKVGWVTGIIVDERGNATPEKRFRAFLSSLDNVPLIIGFKDLLDKFIIHIDSTEGIGFIETK